MANKARVVHLDPEKRRDEYFQNAPDKDMETYTAKDVARLLNVSRPNALVIMRSMEHMIVGERRILVRKPVLRRYMKDRSKGVRP